MATRREVVFDGGAPWGFRMHGGVDQNQPLMVSRVNPCSKASIKGIREGDLITSINGRRTKNLTNLEAHGLLKSAGDSLRLGLNEETNESPKRRQCKTLHQETLEETIKRSSITTYSLRKTVERTTEDSEENIENSVSKNDEKIQLDTSKGLPASDLLVTKRPTTFSSTTSISPEDGHISRLHAAKMSDSGGGSKSKKRRQRRQNRKTNEHITEIQTISNGRDKSRENYVVHSPGEVAQPPTKTITKSKSLDHEDLLRIQELSESSDLDDKTNNPIVSEASESEAEEPLMSPEEEASLRSFLESLQLVSSPEEATQALEDKKQSKARKRAELEEYFLPICQNPRYLEAISEEAGEGDSDREQRSLRRHLKRGTPEPRKAVEQAPAVLLETKLVESESEERSFTAVQEEVLAASTAEIVYLTDSSEEADQEPQQTTDGGAEESKSHEQTGCEITSESRTTTYDFAIKTMEAASEEVNKVISAQLTPPPTPQNLSPKLKETTDNPKDPSSSSHSVISSPPPPPTRSSSSSRSSSRGSSLCTAVYNPGTSSLADVTSLLKEEDCPKAFQALSLRQLCLEFLVALPFGKEVLEELADVSERIDSFTSSLPSRILPNAAQGVHAEANNVSCCGISVRNPPSLDDNKECGVGKSATPGSSRGVGTKIPIRLEELTAASPEMSLGSAQSHTWVGLGSDEAPNALLYLSPTQKNHLDKSKQMPDEAKALLDLHDKFLKRKTDQEAAKKQPASSIRLLTMIHEESVADSARLEAKDLAEWLQMARSKSSLGSDPQPPRRGSLPRELFEKQLLQLREKERDIQRQLEAVEEEKRQLNAEREFHAEDYHFSRRGDFAESKKRMSLPAVPTETFRQRMYEEYMGKFAEREERKQHQVIRVTCSKELDHVEVHRVQLEDEFMDRVKQKQREGKLESLEKEGSVGEAGGEQPPVLVIDGGELKEPAALPRHLREFLVEDGVWSPGQKSETAEREISLRDRREAGGSVRAEEENIPPVWTPKSANSSPVSERKEYRAVNFQSPVLSRKNRTKSESYDLETATAPLIPSSPNYNGDTGTGSTFSDRKLPLSRSTPASGFLEPSTSSRLPKVQNPTVTLLQKAREGQLSKGAYYIEPEQKQLRSGSDRPSTVCPGEVVYHIKNEYTNESEHEKPRKMADLTPRKYEGIGPVTKDGLPLILRSEVKDQNQSKWYKKMYDTIHKQKPHRDEYVTVRYKQKRAQYPYTSGYLSEPEPGAYDSDFADHKYRTLDRRRPDAPQRPEFVTSTMPRNYSTVRSSSTDVLKSSLDQQKPGRIEDYTTGHSSISDKEAKQWWDEVMDIFDGHLERQNRTSAQPKSFMNQALKESGYESDSTLVFRRKEDAQSELSPRDQKQAYRVIQKGGDVPLHGLRKIVPERPKESPRKYVENEVTIHYRAPVRQEIKEYLSEDELAHRQAEAMKKIYQEERRRKYLQELQDMNSRRHTDNFIPSQKSPIALNRYDNFDDLAPSAKAPPKSPDPRLCARALYNFVGQSARELTFRKGDIIYLRRQIDKNWYEGELNAMVGLFPTNYVEIIPFEGGKPAPRKAHEGQARAKYNFVAQSHLELSISRGELVTITRKVDENWFEGKIGGRKGIFPVNYVDVLIDPQSPPPPTAGVVSKPAASPAAHSLLLNGSAGGKESMGAHSYTPAMPPNYLHAKNAHGTAGGGRKNVPVGQALHIETQNDPVPFRALYKYNPQNDDELELLEGDTVYVLEKCDDGWFVGSSHRTGAFGTFPGNYVEKIV